MDRDFSWGGYFSLWLFGIAFGYVEASVVVYLRTVYGLDGEPLFPLITELTDNQSTLTRIEALREFATLILMFSPAYLFSRRHLYRFMAYGIVFGIWDLFFYLFLKLQLDWPNSLFTYDVLFLIPTVWVAPVLCPLLISGSLVFFGSTYLSFSGSRVVRQPTIVHWLLGVVGGALVLYSFTNESAYYVSGGLPPRFSWGIFGTGYGLALLAALHFFYQYRQKVRARFS